MTDEYGMVRVDEWKRQRQPVLVDHYCWQPPRPVKRTLLKQTAGFSFPREHFGTKAEAGDAVGQPAEGVADATGRAAASDPNAERANKQAAEHRKLPDELSVEAVAADGGCLVHSLALGLAFQKKQKKPTSSTQLRAELVAYMGRPNKVDVFRAHWDGFALDGKTWLDSFEKYLAEVATPTAWMGHLELQAAAHN